MLREWHAWQFAGRFAFLITEDHSQSQVLAALQGKTFLPPGIYYTRMPPTRDVSAGQSSRRAPEHRITQRQAARFGRIHGFRY
jgi:hypothetical protein